MSIYAILAKIMSSITFGCPKNSQPLYPHRLKLTASTFREVGTYCTDIGADILYTMNRHYYRFVLTLRLSCHVVDDSKRRYGCSW